MNTRTIGVAAFCGAVLLATSQASVATSAPDRLRGATGFVVGSTPETGPAIEKSTLAQTIGARGTVSPGVSISGGFEIKSTTTVYILVRGNSLGSLGITQNYLDAPRVRVFNAQGNDIAFDTSNFPGFNACESSNLYAAPVWNFYTYARGQAPSPRDSCDSGTLAPGVYTFSVNPTIPGVTAASNSGSSVPSAGEVLFEVTFNP